MTGTIHIFLFSVFVFVCVEKRAMKRRLSFRSLVSLLIAELILGGGSGHHSLERLGRKTLTGVLFRLFLRSKTFPL